MESIKIRVLPGCNGPEQNPKGDWIDVFSADSYYYKAGDSFRISLGFSCQLPEGYEAYLVMRSSTFSNTGLLQTNAVGIIDNTYCGNNDLWQLSVYATRDGMVEQGQKIAQFRIQKSQEVKLEFVDDLNNPDRGGFGSTGC